MALIGIKKILLLLLIGMIGFGIVTADSSIQQSQEAVAEFTGKNLQEISYLETIEFPIGIEYIFTTADGIYYVNQKTGIIEMATFLSKKGNVETIVYSLEEAKILANKYAEQQYDDFNKMNMVLIHEGFYDYGGNNRVYEFVWFEVIEDILMPNVVMVDIHPQTGEVLRYVGVKRPLEIPLVVKIPEKEAVEIALTAFKGIEPTSIDTFLSLNVDSSGQQIIWNVYIKAKEKEGICQGGIVIVDATSGEILFIDHYQ